MKFHFGNNHHHSSSHHYHSGGGNDRGSSDSSGGLAVMMVPAHPSSVLFMDAHPDKTTAASSAEEEGQSSLSEEYRQEPFSSTTGGGGGTPNDDEPAEENDHTSLELPQRSSSKSRQFFRIKGRRSRSSSPVTTDCSSPGQQQHRQEIMIEHQQHCQQHRLNVMDLLRPARLRRSTSLPHTIATAAAATTSTNTASTSTTTSSNHSSATTSNKPRHKRCVTFTNIQIREYNTILGDHPCCQSGPPLALGWEFNKQDEVVIDIDDYENKFIDNNNNHCPCNDHHESGNGTSPSSQQKVRRRSMNELRLNCEDRREILCGLMKPVEEDLTTTTTTTMAVSSSSSSTMMMMMEEDDDGSNENQPQLLQSHQNDSHQQILQPPHTSTTTTTAVCSTTQSSSTPLLPLYTKEELRKAERKLERERRCNSGNAARTRRRLKRGFFMPLTPEEEESYKLNSSGGSLSGNDEHLDYSSSSEDENGVVSMDISPKKEVSQKNSIM